MDKQIDSLVSDYKYDLKNWIKLSLYLINLSDLYNFIIF